jgi:SAM-dependent methyltransferase
MANFLPLKRHMFYCLDRSIEQFGLEEPFLDIGCGRADVSAKLAKRNWSGTAIDYSEAALYEARRTLAPYSRVRLERRDLSEIEGLYRTIILWDVLEHLEHDADALQKIAAHLEPGGTLHLAVPSNPREWRWDDDFYGHYRRYTTDEIRGKMKDAGLETLAIWDFTFPFFWALRRIYTRLKRPPQGIADRDTQTRQSSRRSAWDIPVISFLLDRSAPLWWIVSRVQFSLFRLRANLGHEFFVIARKPPASQA